MSHDSISSTIHDSAARGFDRSAGDYERGRPEYPAAAIDLLARELRIGPGSSVVDLAAGTGKLTRGLIRTGARVIAVEPVQGMRTELIRAVPGAEVLAGTAEAIPLADESVAAVLVAQAFHWFDHPKAIREFRRILKPGGFVALIWNARNTGQSHLMAAYERIVTTYGSDFARSGRELVPYESLRELFGGNLEQHVLPNFQDLDWPGLRGRLLSASYMPLAGQKGHDPMMTDLRSAFDKHQKSDGVRLEYDTRIYLGRLT